MASLRKKWTACSSNMDAGRHAITNEFLIRPSWCDAALCLEQIEKEKATGHKLALKVRKVLQSGLFYFGWFIQRFCGLVLLVGTLIFIAWAIGLLKMKIETNIERLWVPKGGRLEAERNFARSVTVQKYKTNNWTLIEDRTGIGDDSATNYQVLIQTVKNAGENVLTKDQLLLHVEVLESLSKMTIERHNRSWSLFDICFKANVPKSKGGVSDILTTVVKAVLPCVMISPLDCFWEGSIPLGPFPPHNKVFGIPLSWKKLNPQEVLKTMSNLLSSLFDGDEFEAAADMFTRAGVGTAYQYRHCIDPLNAECPKTAPNYVDRCQLVKNFTAWNAALRLPFVLPLVPAATPAPPPVYDDYYDQLQAKKSAPNSTNAAQTTKKPGQGDTGGGGLLDFIGTDDTPNEASGVKRNGTFDGTDQCTYAPYVDAIMQILRSNETLARQFVPGIYENYNHVLDGVCKGFATNFMQWPEQLIIGDIDHDMKDRIIQAGGLQTVIMLANHNDVYRRFKSDAEDDAQSHNVSLDISWWTPQEAVRLIKDWQRKYSDSIFHSPNNTPIRILHPLAAASLEDMVEEFSRFNPMFIIVGYILMIIYACFSALSLANRCVRSNSVLAFVGCLIVLLANISGLGCTLILGIDFNATTTQILPFLLLSLGVDEMFLMLNKYREIVVKLNRDEIGVLLRETGLSVLITYVNNILAFFAGVLLPIPALKIFCVQVAIVLIFNLVAILTLFPAAMALDLKRQRSGRVDFLCCFKGRPVVAKNTLLDVPKTVNSQRRVAPSSQVNYYNGDTVEIGAKKIANADAYDDQSSSGSFWSRCTLTYFVKNVYAPFIGKLPIKIVIVLLFAAVIGASAYGLFFVPIGLELSELVPLGTAPQAFMVAREKYFSFYPMYTVVKGDDPQFGSFAPKAVQKKMHDFVRDTENVSFVVNMKIRTDWLSVMTDWLKFAQEKFDADSIKGAFNESNDDSPKPSRMAKIARKLMCSFGDKTDCGRIGKIRLVDEDGLVSEDGFYNYLTAWYNLDQMTYYVTQANFQPTPPPFDYEKDEHIPAAKHLIFSQIPFYVDRINDTDRILEMINAVRHVCEKYTASGLPVFPLGIPFTFWELYLHLTTSLLTAFAIIIVAVFIAISIILINPWISALIVVVLMLMIIVELGFMGLIHIKLNPISAVTLITAVGIRVKFTVHVALSFLTTVGTRAERVARTLEHMFVPVLHGGLSTLVGLIMLYFSKFEFIVMYYFLVMFFLVILGILSGLILMPIILSWIGPPVEVKSFDNSSYFYPPSMDGRTSNGGKQPQIAASSYPTMEMGFMATNVNQPIKKD